MIPYLASLTVFFLKCLGLLVLCCAWVMICGAVAAHWPDDGIEDRRVDW